MVLDNSNSPYHIEEELWLQVLSLSRELQDCKASLHHNTLDCISDKIEGIERELDVLLIYTREARQRHIIVLFFYDNFIRQISYPIIKASFKKFRFDGYLQIEQFL